MPAGRPTKYDPKFADVARKVCQLGGTTRDVAEAIGVTERTVYRWMLGNQEFCQCLSVGREFADNRVEQSLYRLATGYSFDAVKLAVDAKTGAVAKAKYVEHVPPNISAIEFWLTNRQKEKWRKKVEMEHSAGGDLADLIRAGRERAASRSD